VLLVHYPCHAYHVIGFRFSARPVQGSRECSHNEAERVPDCGVQQVSGCDFVSAETTGFEGWRTLGVVIPLKCQQLRSLAIYSVYIYQSLLRSGTR
jgi:hypothetical protein